MAYWTTAEHRIAMTKPTRTAAKLLKRSPEAVRKYRSRNGIPAVKANFTPAELARIVNLRSQGMPWRPLGELMGRSAPTVRRAYYRLRTKGLAPCVSSHSESASSSG